MIVELRPYLFQGDRLGAEAASIKHKVDVIVFLSLFPLVSTLGKFKTTVINIPMHDEAEDKEKIRIINDVITEVSHAFERKERKILVACDAGMSRSAMICIYHLVYTGMSFDDAEQLIKKKNSSFQPEPSLYLQIRKMLTGT
jgi:protein-tyrosine phosphatase